MTRRIFLVPISSFEPFLKVKDAGCLKSVRRLLFYKKSWRQWRGQLCGNLLFDSVWKMFLIFAEKSWLAHIQESGCLVSGAALLYKENPALDAGFRERYAFDQKSSNR